MRLVSLTDIGSPEIIRKVVLDAKARWRNHQAALSVDSVESEQGYRMALAATFTIEPLEPLLGARFLDEGIVMPRIVIAPYHQVFQVCLNHEAIFEDQKMDAIAILWRIEDLLKDEIERFCGGDASAADDADRKIDDLGAALKTLRASFSGTIVTNTPPYPQKRTIGIRDLLNPVKRGALHYRLLTRWISQAQEIGNVYLLDLDGLQRYYGLTSSGDSRKWYLYKQPFTEGFLQVIAEDLGRILARSRSASKKCVVVDCDNTLWGGIIGEDGIEGIQLGDDFPGSPYRDFQAQLLELRNRGIFLAISSKNNERDVWDVFENHDGMILTRDHISAWRIDWRNKPENIAAIAEELNIGTDSLVFIDDSAFEIEQVRHALPDVTCLQVPEDPARLPGVLPSSCNLFDKLEITEEDRYRPIMIRQEKDRKKLQESLSEQDFLITLSLEVEVAEVDRTSLGRVTQLINRTNQFNLTSLRRSQDEVEALMNSPQHHVFIARAKDRFGEYGLVGVAIVEKEDRVGILDSFLLSCRILGRQVETAFLSVIVGVIRAQGIEKLRASYIPTAKNAPIASFLPNQGFIHVENNDWEVSLDMIVPCPKHIEVQRR